MNVESIEKLRGIASEMRNIGASFLSPHELFRMWAGAIDKSADEIEREIAEKYMLLPVDAESEPIHIGDAMDDGKVAKLVISDDGEHSVYVYKLPNVLHEFYCYETAHVKPDPIKKLLEEYAGKRFARSNMDLDIEGLADDYAAKIREAVSADE